MSFYKLIFVCHDLRQALFYLFRSKPIVRRSITEFYNISYFLNKKLQDNSLEFNILLHALDIIIRLLIIVKKWKRILILRLSSSVVDGYSALIIILFNNSVNSTKLDA